MSHEHDWQHVMHEGYPVAVRCTVCHLTPYEILLTRHVAKNQKTPGVPGSSGERSHPRRRLSGHHTEKASDKA